MVRFLSCIALFSLATLGATGQAVAQLAGKEIHIGVGGPLTTGAASFGVEMRQAVQLAVDERNAAGGILGAKILTDAIDDAVELARRATRNPFGHPAWAKILRPSRPPISPCS